MREEARAVPEPPLVAHLVYRLDYGGLENGIVNLVNNIPAERYRHAIICLAGFNRAFSARLNRASVRLLTVDKKAGKDPGAYVRVWRLLRALRPAIVHTRNLGTLDMQTAAVAAGVRGRIHGEHGWSPTDPDGRDPHNLRLRRLFRTLPQRHVAMSKDISGWLETTVHVAPADIRQIYNGVDTKRFSAHGRMVAAWAGDRRPEVIIGTVGRMDPIKNHVKLLLAIRGILDREPYLRGKIGVTIVGDGPARQDLENIRRDLRLQDVLWLPGARDDVADLMRSMDIFVLPSRNEGISNTILEAMATGLPVVAGNVGGNPELVSDGVTGLLFGVDDVNELMSCLVAYLRSPDLRVSHGTAGAQRVRQHFSLDSMVKGYLDLYDEILNVRHNGNR